MTSAGSQQRGGQQPHQAQQAAKKKRRGLVGAMVMALCIFNILDGDIRVGRTSNNTGGRRSLLSSLYLSGPSTLLPPWAQHHLVDVMDRPDPKAETALFWHIPKSGGTTAKRLYQCMGQTLAHRVGADPKYGHDQESELLVFEPHTGKDWKVVNVDTTIIPGLLRAKELGLVQSHTTDLIFTMEPQFAGQELYDEDNKGRFLALFRHPVDRALSMFYYLQTATWERTYRPEWANMTVMEWARLPNAGADFMVHKLIGKRFGETVDETDLIVAKELVRQRFIVGLMGEMNESIRRFNIVLGVDEESDRSQQCMDEFGLLDREPKERKLEEEEKTRATNDKNSNVNPAKNKKNSNEHPKFEEGSPEFDVLARRNRLDMLLYKYIETLFDAQQEIIDAYLHEEEPREDLQVDPHEESAELALLPPGLLPGSEVNFINNPLEFGSNLANVADPAEDGVSETAFFWLVPRSGGKTLRRLHWCMGSTMANEVGVNPKFGVDHGEHSDLVAFSPWMEHTGKAINVDVTTHKGIMEAKNRGFLSKAGQPHVDFIATSEFQFASMMLFSPIHKARMFALFRHPVDRAVSQFYYLQKDNTQWALMTLEEWASMDRGDNNWMVRALTGKTSTAELTSELTIQDLELAKEIIRTKFVVGLTDKLEESVHRFNMLLGIDENNPKNRDCINELFPIVGDPRTLWSGQTIVKKESWNSDTHPKAVRGGLAWVSLYKIHMYDNLLYSYIAELFAEQRAMFEPAAAAAESGAALK